MRSDARSKTITSTTSLSAPGDLYRHVYPMEDLNRAAWSFVAEDKSEVLLTVVTKSSPLCNVF